MAKGMSMEEFRAAIASDASKENEELKKELQKVKKTSDKEIQELKEEVERYKKQCTQLYNRCAVLTKAPMMMCINCGFEECKYHPTEKEMSEAFEYMEKHKLPRNEESAAKIHSILIEKRSKRLEQMRSEEK